MINDAVVETEDRLTEIEDQITQLFKKTNYEQVKYFKFMNEQIKKQETSIKKHDMYFKEIMELTTCKDRNEKSNIFQAIEVEIYPEIKTKVEELMIRYMSDELKLFVRTVDFKDQIKSLDDAVSAERTINSERSAEVTADIATFKEEISAIKQDFVTAEKFENKLKHFTPMGIFQKTERRFADFVTKRTFNDKFYEL